MKTPVAAKRMRDHAPDCPAWSGSVCRCSVRNPDAASGSDGVGKDPGLVVGATTDQDAPAGRFDSSVQPTPRERSAAKSQGLVAGDDHGASAGSSTERSPSNAPDAASVREWKVGDRCRATRYGESKNGTVVALAYKGKIDERHYLARNLHPAVDE